jgi:hypothetical protein
MRVFAEKVYGIPAEQVVGSSGVTKFEMGSDGKPVLVKEPEVEFIDDGLGKPVGINRFIRRRPTLAFGNSDGDLQMLQWTAGMVRASWPSCITRTGSRRGPTTATRTSGGSTKRGAVARGRTVVDVKGSAQQEFPMTR